jgi:hypothetical protein
MDAGLRDCVAITLYFFVEKRGLLKLSIMNFFKNLGVKPFPKTSLFSLFSNCDTVSFAGMTFRVYPDLDKNTGFRVKPGMTK